MRGGGLFLLLNPDVQKEIGLSESQKTQLQKLMQTQMGGGQRPPQGGQGQKPPQGQSPTPGDFQKRFADMQKKVDAILKPNQKARLDEIGLQMAGPMALLGNDVGKKLGITAKQKSTIQGIAEKARPQMPRQGQGQGQGKPPAQQDWQKIMKDMQAKRDAANKAILATLTADQKAKWAKMTGKPFKMSPRPMGGPGGRPGGGG